ncbi:MAG: class I SAM-dependent methyltransferase [Chloroflexi bacterium]|jgi:predicted O-methyltransferase YrrM|nr:class I SAM-dependent methyltransferase [Anaerolineaceae bacterium]NMB89308.1 class I SAM-dependent methyltransferase [Chloroflexota bacterium]
MSILKLWKYLDPIQSLLVLSAVRGHQRIEGWLSDAEAAGLYELARRLPPDSVIVEIGSWKGKSTYCLGRGLRRGTIYAIDPFDASGEEGSVASYQKMRGATPLLDQFVANMTQGGVISKIRPLAGPSRQFVEAVAHIDLLFIDGDHSVGGCDFDYLNYSPRLRSGGYLIFHDYDPARLDLGPTWVIQNRILNRPEYSPVLRLDRLYAFVKNPAPGG